MTIFEKNGITNAEEIRHRRESECFSYVNRGELWYKTLTEKQKEEFEAWYTAWLDAPQTLVVPTKPTWLV